MNINMSCFCKKNTENHLKFGQLLYWIYTEGKSLIMKLGAIHRYTWLVIDSPMIPSHNITISKLLPLVKSSFGIQVHRFL